MKTFVKLFLLVWLIMPIHLFGQGISTVTYNDAVALFMKSEVKLLQHRKYIAKNRLFEDPLGNDQFVYNTICKKSPDLFESTIRYKEHLLRMLTDASVKKDKFFNDDIVQVLYNLCIEDYVDVMEKAYMLFKNKQITHYNFRNIIIQDFSMSNQVARNYKNQKLQSFLHRLLQDTSLMARIVKEQPYPNFKEEIQDIITGNSWENNLKEADSIQPPYLKLINCK